jgi:hypothetical protein
MEKVLLAGSHNYWDFGLGKYLLPFHAHAI